MIYQDAGEVQAPHVVSGSDVFANVVTATATHTCQASGLDVIIAADTGAGVSTRAGSAIDQLFARIVYVETGSAESPHSASGLGALGAVSMGGAGGWVSYKAYDEMNSDEDEALILSHSATLGA